MTEFGDMLRLLEPYRRANVECLGHMAIGDAAEVALRVKDEATTRGYNAGHADGYHEGRTDRLTPSIDADHLAHQRDWSTATFGPGRRTAGVLDHIRKELTEIESDPTDVMEWVDVIILAFDGAWRAGWEPQEIIEAIKAKQARNEARTWPDWRTVGEGQAIEHDRSMETGR